MFDFLKRKKPETHDETPVITQQPTNSWFSRLKTGLGKTRSQLTNSIANLFLGKKEINADLLEEIETALLSSDVGIETTEQLIKALTEKLARNELNDSAAVFQSLRDEMNNILAPCSKPLVIPAASTPFVILVVGVNGSGKTTTIGKLVHLYLKEHHSILLAAGDTFRAAAIAQLTAWGEKNQVPVISQPPGADTAAVIYDALEAATARKTNILLADTAGRLHTQSHLMKELQKVKRVIGKIDVTAPHETLIVLDATLGQNALQQVKQYHAEIGVTGIVLTKLDGTAKGGIIFAIAKQMGIPIRYIGVGEGIEDLRPFVASEFIDALLGGEG